MNRDESAKTVRNAAKVSFGVLFSRLLGLVRDISLAYVLGGGWLADIFLAAFRIPNFTRRLVYEGAVAMAFLPFFSKLRLQKGDAEAFAFGRAAVAQFLIVALVIAMICIYASQSIAVILLPGFAEDYLAIELAGELMRITFFFLPLVVAAALISGMLLALERYLVPSISTACVNVGMIAAAVFAVFAGYSGYAAARILCYGLLAGGLLQILLQLPALRQAGFSVFGRVAFYSSETRSFFRKAPQTVFGSASYQLGVVITMIMASFLGQGNVTALYFAERILELPLAVVGIALGTASLGNFSSLVLQGERRELALRMREVIAMGLCFSLPAAVGCLALALPIMGAFFAHGAFGDHSLDLAVRALIFYTPTLPAIVLSRPLLAALNAAGRAGTTMFVAALSLLVLVGASWLLLSFMDIEAITIGASISAWFNTIALALLLRRSKVCAAGRDMGQAPVCGPGDEPGKWPGFFPWKSLVCYLAYSLIMLGVLIFMQYAADYLGMGYIPRLLLGVPLGAAVYLLLCRIFRSPELALLRRSFF
ncbi:MAG: murein biosynthesis integral membrane protein MurJ [Deltaproteobacteria bacterium]|jgi:putative peptidoglycan lipid II flippase|nr:murein biosynthesis integral membrane protein MurJ [Deltaproteobacteria bacterium]